MAKKNTKKKQEEGYLTEAPYEYLAAPVDVAPESALQAPIEEHVEPAQLSLFAYYQHRMEREANS